MESRIVAIGVTIAKCGQKHGKHYSFPSQAKLRELVNRYHGFGVSERTIRRDIKEMVDTKWLKSIRRTRLGPDGKRVWTSNLYKLGRKFFMWLRSLEVLTKGLFSHFHRPILADNQLKQKQASSVGAPSSVEMLLIKERDGTPSRYDPRTGEYLR